MQIQIPTGVKYSTLYILVLVLLGEWIVGGANSTI
jgi:hypothetical protein